MDELLAFGLSLRRDRRILGGLPVRIIFLNLLEDEVGLYVADNNDRDIIWRVIVVVELPGCVPCLVHILHVVSVSDNGVAVRMIGKCEWRKHLQHFRTGKGEDAAI